MRLSGRVRAAVSDGETEPPGATVAAAEIVTSLLMTGCTVKLPGATLLMVCPSNDMNCPVE